MDGTFPTQHGRGNGSAPSAWSSRSTAQGVAPGTTRTSPFRSRTRRSCTGSLQPRRGAVCAGSAAAPVPCWTRRPASRPTVSSPTRRRSPLIEPRPALPAVPLSSAPVESHLRGDRTRPALKTTAGVKPTVRHLRSAAALIVPHLHRHCRRCASDANRPTDLGRRRWRRWSWAAVALLVALAVYAVIDRQDPPTPDPPMVRTDG